MPQDGRLLHPTRRGFLRLLTAGVAGHALDIDKLLWVPGAKTFFLPSIVKPTTSQIVALELERIMPKIHMLFERDDAFYRLIDSREAEIISTREIKIPWELKK